MNKIAIIALLLIYILYLISDFFLGRASPEIVSLEFIHFAVFVFAAGLSFFRLGMFRFFLLCPYAVLAWRCLEAIPEAYAGDYVVFWVSCLFALLLIVIVGIGILADNGKKLPKTKLLKANVLLWLLVLSLSSRLIVFAAVSGPVALSIFLGSYVFMFVLLLYISAHRRWIFIVQLCFLVVVSVPCLLSFSNGFDALFSKEYAMLTLFVVASALVVVMCALRSAVESRA